jgi:phage baseplate assembly protein W
MEHNVYPPQPGDPAIPPDEKEYIREIIREFIATNPGEKPGRPSFGAGLVQLAFEPNTPELIAAVQFRIHSGLTEYLGHLIRIHEIAVENNAGEVRVSVQYEIRKTGELCTDMFLREFPQF